MTSIFSGTRLAFLVGERPKERRYYGDNDDDLPTISSTDGVIKPQQQSNKMEPMVPSSKASAMAKGRQNSRAFKLSWLIFGLLTVLIPLITRNVRMNQYQNRSWRNTANQYNNQYYQGGQQNNQYQDDQAQQSRFTDVNNCKWYSFSCTPYYVDEGGNHVSEYEMQQEKYRQQYEQKQQQYQQQAQQTQEQNQYYQYQNQAEGQANYYSRQQAVQAGEPTAALRFVYGWQIIMFLGILAYGYNAMKYGKHLGYLIGALVVWFQFNFLAMFMLADGSIISKDRVGDLSGYYGQFAVLMFMTDACYAVFGLVFAMIFMIKTSHSDDDDSHDVVLVSHDDSIVDKSAHNYRAYQAPAAAEPPAPKATSSKNKTEDADGDFVKVV